MENQDVTMNPSLYAGEEVLESSVRWPVHSVFRFQSNPLINLLLTMSS